MVSTQPTPHARLAEFLDRLSANPGIDLTSLKHTEITVLVRRSIGHVLKTERERKSNFHLKHLARQISVGVETLRGIEAGELRLDPPLLSKISANIPTFQHYVPLIRQAYTDLSEVEQLERSAAQQPQEPTVPTPETDATPIADPTITAVNDHPPASVPRPKPDRPPERMPFHVALWTLRNRDGLSQDDVAVVLNVHRSTVVAWENNEINPIREHYKQLCDLLTGLNEAVAPPSRDIAKPGRPTGVPMPPRPPEPKDTMATTSPPTAEPPPTPAAASDPFALVLLLEDVRSSPDKAKFVDLLRLAAAHKRDIATVLALLR